MADLDDTDDLSEDPLSTDDDLAEGSKADVEDDLDGADEIGDEDEEIDGLLNDLGAHDRPGDARRRIEDYLEMKRAARELSELDGYDFD